jgi:hypothetical protein
LQRRVAASQGPAVELAPAANRPSSFRRITSSGPWVPEVDGIRFVAITLVLLQHIHERVLRRTEVRYPEVHSSGFDQLLMQGDAGVWIIFALSAYILGKSLISPMDSRTRCPSSHFLPAGNSAWSAHTS